MTHIKETWETQKTSTGWNIVAYKEPIKMFNSQTKKRVEDYVPTRIICHIDLSKNKDHGRIVKCVNGWDELQNKLQDYNLLAKARYELSQISSKRYYEIKELTEQVEKLKEAVEVAKTIIKGMMKIIN